MLVLVADNPVIGPVQVIRVGYACESRIFLAAATSVCMHSKKVTFELSTNVLFGEDELFVEYLS